MELSNQDPPDKPDCKENEPSDPHPLPHNQRYGHPLVSSLIILAKNMWMDLWTLVVSYRQITFYWGQYKEKMVCYTN